MINGLIGTRAARVLTIAAGLAALGLAACAPIKPPPPPTPGTPGPTITGLDPDCGPEAGGNFITIFGTGLSDVQDVAFGTAFSNGGVVVSDNEITAEVPPGIGIVDVTVFTTDDFTDDTPADDYQYAPVPAITGLNPTFGPGTGGNSVVITGTGLFCVESVSFGATAATSFTVDSDAQITAVAPAGTGTVDVSVTTDGGTTANTAADNYSYGPTVTMLNPVAGPVAGGNSVTITGTNFNGATAVSFGGTPATGFTVDNNTQITATAPAHAAGTVNVSVTTPAGTSPNTAADDYRYAPVPTITGLAPTAGPEAGGTTVTIGGSGFTGAGTVWFGPTLATSFTVVNDGQIDAVAPAGTGTVSVSVVTFGGTTADTAADDYTYAPVPTVTSLNPAEGPEAGGTSVIITGTGFKVGTVNVTSSVTFGSSSATSFTVDSDTQITATAPAGTGTVNVKVSTAGGDSSVAGAGDNYTYVPAPTVTDVNPNTGPAIGSTPITITGTNFQSGSTTATVTVGGVPCTSVLVVNATTITCVTPAGMAGTVNVTVTTAGGPSADNGTNDDFTYF